MIALILLLLAIVVVAIMIGCVAWSHHFLSTLRLY
jgi:hypothetical protein